MTETNSANQVDIQHQQLILDRLHVEDLSALMEIEKRSFTAPWSEDTYRHELVANPLAFYYVIRPPRIVEQVDTKRFPPPLLAYGGFWLTGDEAHIVTIASHYELRGRSLGETMLLFILQQAQSLGASIVSLEVRPSNTPAISLYRKWGFVEEGRRVRYYKDDNEDALIYTLRDLEHPMTIMPIVMTLGINVTSTNLPKE